MAKIRGVLSLGVCLALAQTAWAGASIDTLDGLSQEEFEGLSEDLGAAFSYKPVVPTEPLGILGFDVGAEISVSQIANDQVLGKVSNSEAQDYISVARLHAHKGLPFGVDVGLSYGDVLESNANLLGVEARYAFLEGTTLTPAVGVRATYTHMSGAEVMDFATQSLDISASKGILMFTPYAGVGYVWSQSDPTDTTHLSSADQSQAKIFGGAGFSILLLNATVEYDNTGGNNTFSLKLGVRF